MHVQGSENERDEIRVVRRRRYRRVNPGGGVGGGVVGVRLSERSMGCCQRFEPRRPTRSGQRSDGDGAPYPRHMSSVFGILPTLPGSLVFHQGEPQEPDSRTGRPRDVNRAMHCQYSGVFRGV